VLPDRSDSDWRNANGRYTKNEVTQAQYAARRWVEMMLFTEPEPTVEDVVSWLTVHAIVRPADMAMFHAAGITAEEVARPFWNEQTNPGRMSLFEAFIKRTMTAETVIADVLDYRSCLGAMPPSA